MIGVGIALEIVDECGAGIETKGGMAEGVEFDGATKIESIAPRAFIGGRVARDKSLVVVDETVAGVGEESPFAKGAAEFGANNALLCTTMLTKSAGTREKIHDGIKISVFGESVVEIKTVARQELFAAGAGFAIEG